ncbi:unnamed protein product [Trichobilharzia regenti]|nr:unnamed protein product [Trichobilharzia regenti]
MFMKPAHPPLGDSRSKGGTQDEAVVEVTCSSTFYLLEPEYAFSMTSKSPVEIVSTQTQLCVLSALSHLEWNYLEHGNAKVDLANETKVMFKILCKHDYIIYIYIAYFVCLWNIV